jgi:hypothetical protein
VEYADFISSIEIQEPRAVDRAIAVLWLGQSIHATPSMTAQEIAEILHSKCGYPKQNVSRLDTHLKTDKRVVRHGTAGWRLHPRAKTQLDDKYETTTDDLPRKAKQTTGSVIPIDLVRNTRRGYLVRVVDQINASYDHGLYDCVTVMTRRLLETLIIEVYERLGRTSEIKVAHNNYFKSFDELIQFASKDHALNLGRESVKALQDNKQLGDQSAHNRRFNARRSDIDDVRRGLRIVSEELIHLCNFDTAADPDVS